MSSTTVPRALCLIVTFGLTFWTWHAVRGEEVVTEQDAGPVPFQKIVEFEKPVHFLTPDGKDIVIAPGGYSVEIAQEGLRLKAADTEAAESVTIQAQPVTHEEAVEAPEPVTMSAGDDQQVVMVLQPEGKALQAVGTFSGVQSRDLKLQAAPSNRPVLQFLPKINGIFTVPQLAALSPGGKLYVKGSHFGVSKGKVTLNLTMPISHAVDLSIEEWSDAKITATMPAGISGVVDHPATFQVRSTTGLTTSAWKVPFYATRQTKVLKSSDPAVKVVHCSTGGDYNKCNSLNTSTGGSCFAKAIIPIILTTSLYAQHVNCDVAVDWDKGKDRYDVTLKNGWVFLKVEYIHDQSSPSEKVNFGDYAALRRNLLGATSWKPEIEWEVSPGPDQLEYGFWLTIEGPKGVPHY